MVVEEGAMSVELLITTIISITLITAFSIIITLRGTGDITDRKRNKVIKLLENSLPKNYEISLLFYSPKKVSKYIYKYELSLFENSKGMGLNIYRVTMNIKTMQILNHDIPNFIFKDKEQIMKKGTEFDKWGVILDSE